MGQPEADSPVAPTSSYMVESAYPRDGVGVGNEINGRDRDTSWSDGESPSGPEELQFACVFPLPELIDCSNAGGRPCQCVPGDNDSPLCAQSLDSTEPTTTQYWAQAYPGNRHLQILQQLGAQATVGSICPAGVRDTSREDHGYRPVVAAWVDAMASSLGAMSDSGQ